MVIAINRTFSSFAFNRITLSWILVRNGAIRRFSGNKTFFMRNLTARHIAVLMFDLTVKQLVSSLERVEELEKRFVSKVAVTTSEETEGYNARKKFVLIENNLALSADREIKELNNIINTLATKPDWIDEQELKEILEDLRVIVGAFFCSMEALREAGSPYLDGRDALREFPRNNKVLEHCAEVKSAAGLLSVDIKRNLKYLSGLLKQVQRKWSWLGDEERKIIMLNLSNAWKEKKKLLRKERRKERGRTKLLMSI